MMGNHWFWILIFAACWLVLYWLTPNAGRARLTFRIVLIPRGPNAVWFGLAFGIVVGLMIATFLAFRGSGFGWSVVGKAAVVGTLLGFIAELPGLLKHAVSRRR